MSSESWRAILNQALKANTRTAVLGIEIVRVLQELLPAQNHLLLIEAGSAPENVLGVLRRFQPEFVLLIDAAQLDVPSGTIGWIDWQMVDGMSASSHTLPFSALAHYLRQEYGCTVALLGIQPTTSDLCSNLSVQAQAAKTAVVNAFAEAVELKLPQAR